MGIRDLPALNAILNGSAALLLLAGWFSIRAGNVKRHRILMLSALALSIAFLTSYLVYHAQYGTTRFATGGIGRVVYFSILISHTILAVVVAPLIVVTVSLALRGRVERHRRWARRTLPIWLYVSVTGVLIYLMLYQWFAPV